MKLLLLLHVRHTKELDKIPFAVSETFPLLIPIKVLLPGQLATVADALDLSALNFSGFAG